MTVGSDERDERAAHTAEMQAHAEEMRAHAEQVRSRTAQPDPVPEAEVTVHPRGDGSGFLVVRDGYEVVELDGPRRPRRMHRFDDLETFAGWLNRKAEPDSTEIFVGTEGVAGVLDPKEIHEESVFCELRYEPELQAIRETWALEEGLTLKAFHDLVRAFRRFILGSDQLLAELRVASVKAVDEVRTEIDETGAVRLSGATGTRNFSGKIPPEIVLQTRFYQGLRAEPFDVELQVNVSLEPLRFKLACPAWELHQVEGRSRVLRQLGEDLEEGFLVALGTPVIGKRPGIESDLDPA